MLFIFWTFFKWIIKCKKPILQSIFNGTTINSFFFCTKLCKNGPKILKNCKIVFYIIHYFYLSAPDFPQIVKAMVHIVMVDGTLTFDLNNGTVPLNTEVQPPYR